jgi:hypothetical protein
MKKTLLLALSLILWASLSWGATYTVCASGCDQTTIQAVFDGTDLAPDDIVEVRAASPGATATFRETVTWGSNDSGAAGNPVTLQGRAGDTIIISGSDLITTWTQVGATNVYQAACDWAANILYEDGVRKTFKTWNTNIATTDLAVNQWTLDTTGDLVYVWASDGADPDTHTMEIGVRNQVLDTNEQSYLTIDGITLRDGNDIAGADGTTIQVGYNTVAGITIQNCTIERSAGVGILIGGVTATSFTINNCTIRNNGMHGIQVDGDFAAGTISNSTVTGNGWGSVRDSAQYSGIQGHLGNINIFGNTIYDNTSGTAFANNTNHGIYQACAHGVTAGAVNIYQNTIYDHDNGNGIKLIGYSNVYRNLIYGNRGAGIEAGQNGTANVVYDIYYNVIYSNNSGDAGSGIVEQTKGAGTISITINNNAIYKNADASCQEIAISDDVNVLTIKNNIIWATDTRRTVRLSVAQTGTVAINNNLHWRGDGDPHLYNAGADHTWVEWQGHGYDAAGVNADPLFVSATDFRLQSASPAKDVGDDTVWSGTASITDYKGTNITNGAGTIVAPGDTVDMGAMEYYAATVVLTDVGADELLKVYFNNDRPAGGNDLTLRLYVADRQLADTDTTCPTAAAGGGYADKTLTNGSWTVTTANDPSDSVYAQQTWTFTGPLTGTYDTIYGYCILDSDSTVIVEEKFSSYYKPTQNGDLLRLTPKIKMSKGMTN